MPPGGCRAILGKKSETVCKEISQLKAEIHGQLVILLAVIRPAKLGAL